MSDGARKLVIRSAGILIILIAFAAVLLPLAQDVPARRVIGWMLLVGGGVELVAAAARWRHGATAAIAGGATLLAGARLLLDPGAGFFEVLNLVILWLVVRAAAFGYSAFRAGAVFRSWLGLAAAIDFLLAVALLAGLPIALLVVGLFGPTRPISGTFAWVIALSFVVNGGFLLATAALNSRSRRRHEPAPPAQAG